MSTDHFPDATKKVAAVVGPVLSEGLGAWGRALWEAMGCIADDEACLRMLSAYIAAAVAAERERCAKVCESVASNLENAEEDAQALSMGAQSCADQIRAGA